MAKSLFTNRASEYDILDVEVAIDEAYNVVERRFPTGSYVLPYDNSIKIKWREDANPYNAMRIFTFTSDGEADMQDVMAMSTVSYSSFGEYDRDHPLYCDTRTSKKGHIVPSADMIASENPFHWDVKRTGNTTVLPNGDIVETVRIKPRRMEVAEVIGEKWVLVADYDTSGNVIMVDREVNGVPVRDATTGEILQTPKFRRKRKPIFQLRKIEELPERLQEILKSNEVASHF